MKCGPEELHCGGGIDYNGCPEPNFCIPTKGPMGKDGVECPNQCPVKCSGDDMRCWGGKDMNDCPAKADFCMPSKGLYANI